MTKNNDGTPFTVWYNIVKYIYANVFGGTLTTNYAYELHNLVMMNSLSCLMVNFNLDD